jgi:hypothetical protein
MKIEIGPNDILGDEYGTETLQESVRRQVIENLTRTIKGGIGKKIDIEVARILNEELQKVITEKMPAIVDDVLSAEYIPVDRWGGSKGTPTTFRAELVKAINEQMQYKPARYDSDKNAFTRAVDARWRKTCPSSRRNLRRR